MEHLNPIKSDKQASTATKSKKQKSSENSNCKRNCMLKTAPVVRGDIQGLNGPWIPWIRSREIGTWNSDILESIIVQPIRALRRNHLRLMPENRARPSRRRGKTQGQIQFRGKRRRKEGISRVEKWVKRHFFFLSYNLWWIIGIRIRTVGFSPFDANGFGRWNNDNKKMRKKGKKKKIPHRDTRQCNVCDALLSVMHQLSGPTSPTHSFKSQLSPI